MDRKKFTYQSRIVTTTPQSEFLFDMSKLLGHIERTLFAAYNKGINLLSLKKEYLEKYKITARQFNAIVIMLQGKIASCETLREEYILTAKHKIKKYKNRIRYLSKIENKTQQQQRKLYHAGKALAKTERKLKYLKIDQENGTVRICFGSKRLFRKQFNLKLNNYATHDEWYDDWQHRRNKQFYLIGSKDETMGNQSCVATINDDLTINLKIRVPHGMVDKYGKHVEFRDISLNHGKTEILDALKNNSQRAILKKKGNQETHGDLFKQYGIAVNYRFLHDEKGWRAFITVDKIVKHKNSYDDLGAIGVDINEAHLAVTETDRTGNPVNSFNIPLCTYGKTSDQAKAIIGDATKIIVNYAASKHKPIVMEKLDFVKKKLNLANIAAKKARMLSSFAYSQIISMLESRAFRCGVTTYKVNPAYSSIIGRVKFAKIYNLSVHQAAALVIARRQQNFSEKLPRYWDDIPDNTGGHVTLPRLVKIKDRHVWHTWAKCLKNFKAVLAAQYQKLRSSCTNNLVLPGNLDLDSAIPF